LASVQEGQSVIFPYGYLANDKMLYFHLADLITRYHVKTIVIGYPSKQKDIQEKIQHFMKSLMYIIDKNQIAIETVDEDYTSVQAGEIISNFKKNVAEDTISAMLILQRYLDEKAQQTQDNPAEE
jgi:RNase H-fold protein (predicted Holliday junction resolvase)